MNRYEPMLINIPFHVEQSVNEQSARVEAGGNRNSSETPQEQPAKYACDVCGEHFSMPVNHCPQCGGHGASGGEGLTHDYCRNCKAEASGKTEKKEPPQSRGAGVKCARDATVRAGGEIWPS